MAQIGSLLIWARPTLAPSASAALDAELLLAEAVERDRAWVLAHPEAEVAASAEQDFRRLIDRRARGEPVAYLRGRIEWFGLELEVTPEVLVPRPETELVLETALELALKMDARQVADIGTGSGAIAIALAKRLPGVVVTGVDISEDALRVAERNVEHHGVRDRVRLKRGNLLEPVAERPDLVVANLPYLSNDLMASRDRDVRHEPPLALHGGPGGLEIYRELLSQLRGRHWSIPVVIEIDPRLTKLPASNLGPYSVEIQQDYAGLDRIMVIHPAED